MPMSTFFVVFLAFNWKKCLWFVFLSLPLWHNGKKLCGVHDFLIA